jgi:hypothetical protein
MMIIFLRDSFCRVRCCKLLFFFIAVEPAEPV